MFTSEQLKGKLKKGGWSYRSAAPVLGCTYQNICLVVNGQRHSARLAAAIMALPTFEQWRKTHEQTNH